MLGVSGGKDSTAAALALQEFGLQPLLVTMDTGWEAELTYQYLDYLRSRIGPITRLDAGLDLPGLIRRKGMFPGRRNRFCTEELKLKPLRDFLDSCDFSAISVVGIRRQESAARRLVPELEWSRFLDCWVWRPLYQWSLANVIAIHHAFGIRPNPLYMEGCQRVGCFPCISSSKEEIRAIKRLQPERLATLETIEAEVISTAAARYAKRGETFESLGYEPPRFFHRAIGGTRRMWPVADVVEWAHTERGGKIALQEETAPLSGCMRWGLCDAPVS